MQQGMNRREMLGIMGGALGVASLAAPESFIERVALLGASRETDAATWRAERRFVHSKLGRIAYVERGVGDVALFLHGFPLNGFQWRGALDRLSPHRRCIAPDFLALGYTDVAEGQSVTPSAQVDMLDALLELVGASGRLDLVANDSGGAVAQLFLARHPERVRSILLTNCDTEPDSPPPALLPVIRMARAGTYPDQWLVPWVYDKSLARGPHGLGGLTFTRPASLADETIDTYLAPLVATPRRKALVNAYAIALEQNPLASIGPVLARCTAPTRIIWGTGDDIFSRDSPRYLDRAFGNSRGVRLVEGAKLFFPEEYPDLIAEEARALWGIS